jgi:hypothetical protein
LQGHNRIIGTRIEVVSILHVEQQVDIPAGNRSRAPVDTRHE